MRKPRFPSVAATGRHCLGILVACSSAWASPVLIAQPPAQPQAPAQALQSDPAFSSWKRQQSVAGCARCHGGESLFTPDTSFSRQDELRFWLNQDKHAIARRRIEPLTPVELKGELNSLLAQLEQDGIPLDSVPADWFGASNVLSRRICDKLGYDVTNTEGYAQFRDNCLTCHGGYRGERDNQDFAKDAGEQPGISCNYCHQIDDNDAWVGLHGVPRAAEQWRLLPPAEKSAAGMRDLVHTATQAANCNDCHIGNRDKNMFVTHVMYAAGHPMLPAIELQTFRQSMPPHWRTKAEQFQSLEAFDQRERYYQTNFPKLFEGDRIRRVGPGDMFWQTRNVLIGAVSAKMHWLDLLVASSSQDRWADYSLYDCAACHHELREPSPRQKRANVAAPGRPRTAEWPDALVGVALDMAGSNHRLASDQLNDKLAAAMAQTPFGDPAVVAPIAKELREQLAAAVQTAESKAITAAGARAILQRYAQTSADRLLVYDAARQLVWAMQVIAAELEAMGEPLPTDVALQIQRLSGSHPDAPSTGIEATLPAGRSVFIYPENLEAELIRRAEFDPTVLCQRLQQIADQMTQRQ